MTGAPRDIAAELSACLATGRTPSTSQVRRASQELDRLGAWEAYGRTLRDQFIQHRTATHRVASKECLTCQASQILIDNPPSR